MPVVDRRRVRREECRADAVTRRADADVLAALKEIAVAIGVLSDVVEIGFADLTAALRKETL